MAGQLLITFPSGGLMFSYLTVNKGFGLFLITYAIMFGLGMGLPYSVLFSVAGGVSSLHSNTVVTYSGSRTIEPELLVLLRLVLALVLLFLLQSKQLLLTQTTLPISQRKFHLFLTWCFRQ